MIIKKFLIAGLIFTSAITYAQKNKVQSALIYEREGDLPKALEAIEMAAANPTTSNSAKTWATRASIIYKMMLGNAQPFADPIAEIETSVKKIKELDSKAEYAKQLQFYNEVIVNGTINNGIKAYEAKDYAKALAAFEKVLEARPNDTAIIVNAAAMAQYTENSAKTKYYLNRQLELGQKKASIFQTLAQISLQEKDTLAAAQILERGLKIHPGDIGLVIDELNIFLARGQSDKAISKLEKASEIDSKNERIFFALGTAYEKIGDKSKAEQAYRKSMELNDKFFDPVYNLGAIYFNEAVELANAANKIPYNQVKKFNEAEKAYKDKMREAQPILEKALSIKEDDESTLFSLQQLYAKIGENSKSVEMKQRREALKKK